MTGDYNVALYKLLCSTYIQHLRSLWIIYVSVEKKEPQNRLLHKKLLLKHENSVKLGLLMSKQSQKLTVID